MFDCHKEPLLALTLKFSVELVITLKSPKDELVIPPSKFLKVSENLLSYIENVKI